MNKNLGQVFTPNYIVNNMLDLIEYRGFEILDKYIMENSCGNGAFLLEIVKRYCNTYLEKYKSIKNLKESLEKYIYGIEFDKSLYQECIDNINNLVCNKYGLNNINWKIYNQNTLEIFSSYKNMFDFVIGNPPYVRVHNLEHKINFAFNKNGMTDLYLTFYDIGLKMLKYNGKLCLITPSSFLRSNAGSGLREYILKEKNIVKIIDLEHFQPFKATTYVLISLFDKSYKKNYFEYFKYDNLEKKPIFINNININECFIDSKIILELNPTYKSIQKNKVYDNKILVKNGYATLADSIFISNFNFKSLTIDVLKASNSKWLKCIYPYDEYGKLLSLEFIKSKDKEVYYYLKSFEEKLINRSIVNKNEWYGFGRSQAILDTYKNKIAINQIIKNVDSIKIEKVESGKGIFSGLYILTDYSFLEIYSILKNNEFFNYVKSLKNYKNGGYYTFSSKDLEKFLNFKLNNMEV